MAASKAAAPVLDDDKLFEEYQKTFSAWKVHASNEPNHPMTMVLQMMARNFLREAEGRGLPWAVNNTDFEDNPMFRRMKEIGQDWDRPFKRETTVELKRKLNDMDRMLADTDLDLNMTTKGDLIYTRERVLRELLYRGSKVF